MELGGGVETDPEFDAVAEADADLAVAVVVFVTEPDWLADVDVEGTIVIKDIESGDFRFSALRELRGF